MSIRTFFKNIFYMRRLKKSGLQFPLYCKIHGVKDSDRQGALAQSRKGDRLQFVHIPKERFPYNIYVYSIPLNRVLGYLDEKLSAKLVYVFKKNFCRDAVITEVTGGKPHPYLGCNICLFETLDMMKDCEDFSHLRGA